MNALSMMVEKESGDIKNNVFGSVWKAIDSHGSFKYGLFLPPKWDPDSTKADVNVSLPSGTRTLSLDQCRPTCQTSATAVFLPM